MVNLFTVACKCVVNAGVDLDYIYILFVTYVKMVMHLTPHLHCICRMSNIHSSKLDVCNTFATTANTRTHAHAHMHTHTHIHTCTHTHTPGPGLELPFRWSRSPQEVEGKAGEPLWVSGIGSDRWDMIDKSIITTGCCHLRNMTWDRKHVCICCTYNGG